MRKQVFRKDVEQGQRFYLRKDEPTEFGCVPILPTLRLPNSPGNLYHVPVYNSILELMSMAELVWIEE